MQISREDRVRMERAHVLAWPALNTAVVDGWLWRSSGGGSQRANSVSTIDFIGSDIDGAMTDVQARYRLQGAPARFQTFDETSPNGLVSVLQARGYRETEPTVTMFKRAGGGLYRADVDVRNSASPEWRSCYLGEIAENRRIINASILDRIPEPRAFFGYRQGTQIISTALCVAGFGCAVIECVTTRLDARRRGAARAVLTALETWAARQAVDWIALQVVATNTPAVRLYEQLGFVHGATNRFWIAPTAADASAT
jgi:ribosomal protein S18 acetylase RimI-like enzyme